MEYYGALMVQALSIQPRIVQAKVGVAGATGLFFTEEDMEGSIKSYKGSKPNEATITIHNLSEAKIAQLEAPNQVLHILAGETVPGSLFIGDIAKRGVVTKNSLPNRQTTITAKDGRRTYRDLNVSRAYPPNTPIANVVNDLATLATLPPNSLALSPSNVTVPGAFPAGWSFQGKWRQALAEILLPLGFYYSIQGKVLYILSEASTAPGNVPLISPATGLDGSPTRTDKGCNFKSKLNPEIVAGRGVQVTSQFFNGLYRAVNVDHQFSRRGTKWDTMCQAEVIK
jgi:hypothetical protein